ncbi:MAG: hypothetical protein QG670_2507 [Thermoproteota archaeon]|nr:hypothetical protein [Thermoproteota archaeon]
MENSLLRGLVIKGNNENDIKSIFDPNVCKRIMNIKDTLYRLEIGYGKKVSETTHDVEIGPNALCIIDSQSYLEGKVNARSIQ